MQHYQLAYDVAAFPPPLGTWVMAVLAPPVILPLAFAQQRKRRLANPRLNHPAARAFSAFVFVILALIWSAMMLGLLVSHVALVRQRLAGKYEQTEGCLDRFHAGPKLEGLKINGLEFDYADAVLLPGFNHTQANGGPIHADSKVRIGYIGRNIVRVETIDHACPRAPDFHPADPP